MIPIIEQSHDYNWSRVKLLPQDFEPWGQVSRENEEYYRCDCSCGCRWFEAHDLDWGRCHNPDSHRYRLLTFEHQGCLKFESWPDYGDEL